MIEVMKTHPLAEIIAKKLFGIDSVPRDEQRKMVNRACRAAVDYHITYCEELLKPKPHREEAGDY